MFYFLNFPGDNKSQSYDQGVLFEKLVKKIVDALGFRIIEWREKISGKEYDVRAEAKLGRRMLIGEAKARRETQTMPVITGFVGSLDHEDLPNDTLGLFISISDIAPDARDWLGKTRKRDRIEVIVDREILSRLAQIGYPTTQQIKLWAETRFGMRTGDTHLVVSDRGDFFIQTLARKSETRIKAFCAYDSSGTLIDEADFGKELKSRIEDLSELFFLTNPESFSTPLDSTPGRIGPDKEGTGWFEHKLPAPPDCFVGRIKQLQDFRAYIDDVIYRRTSIRVYQVLSPSGVGKSSFLLKAHSDIESTSVAIFQDARNFRGIIDLLSLLQEFVELSHETFGITEIVPANQAGVLASLLEIDKHLEQDGKIGILFIDQFESLFLKPDLYSTLLDLVLEVINACRNVVFCITRKNDQPTTFDELEEINLQRLRQLSRSTELRDFSSEEATELISHLDHEIGQSLKPKLRDTILEFSASGFPWLVKRIGAHIRDSVVKHGRTQDELIQNGVRPDELFLEDLAEIDIADREFLKELVHYLPATLDDLGQVDRFRGKLLSIKLRLFQDQRLVRLIGRTYDTYNDVFKYYLKHGEIPHPNKYTFRSSPATSIKLLKSILEHKPATTESVETIADLEPGTVPNVLRELRMLELVDYARGQLSIDDEALRAYHHGELETLVKERVWKNNGLVADILNRVATEGELELDVLIGLMRESLPVLQLSEKTWNFYARTLVNWLRFVGLTKPGAITSDGRALGITRRGPRSGYFLPSSYLSEIVALISQFAQHPNMQARELEERARFDCTQLGLIEAVKSEVYQLTPLGRVFLSDSLIRPKVIREFLADLSYVDVYLSKIEHTSESHIDVLRNTLGDTAFTEQTWLWRSKVLANWLEFAELIQRRSGRIIRSKQLGLFDH
jgi:hypothetical protein